MCLYSIATEYYGALEAAHAHNDDNRYDMVECGAAGKPILDLSDQLQGCSIAVMYAIHLGSANVLVKYRHRV